MQGHWASGGDTFNRKLPGQSAGKRELAVPALLAMIELSGGSSFSAKHRPVRSAVVACYMRLFVQRSCMELRAKWQASLPGDVRRPISQDCAVGGDCVHRRLRTTQMTETRVEAREARKPLGREDLMMILLSMHVDVAYDVVDGGGGDDDDEHAVMF